MQVFIGKIPHRVNERQIEDYFSQFGKVMNLSLKGTYGFLSYEHENSVDAVLNQRSHVIDGAAVSVERARGAKRLLDGDHHDRYMDGGRGGYMSPPRDRRGYDPRYPSSSMYGSRSPMRYDSRYDRHGGRSPEYYRYDGHRSGDVRRDREYCDYCNACPVHGIRDMASDSRKRYQTNRDHPNNYLKVVFENMPLNTTIDDFKEFVRGSGFDPSYGRMGYSGTHAILEFKTVGEKDKAIRELNGVTFNGSVLEIRSYLSRDEYNKTRSERGELQETDGQSTGVDEVRDQQDIYGETEETKTEN